LQRRRRCRPIEWPDANPACRLTVYHRAPAHPRPQQHRPSMGEIWSPISAAVKATSS